MEMQKCLPSVISAAEGAMYEDVSDDNAQDAIDDAETTEYNLSACLLALKDFLADT